MCCKLSSTAAQGISSQTLTWGYEDLMRRRERERKKKYHIQRERRYSRGLIMNTRMYSHARLACTPPPCRANTLCMEFHNGRRGFPKLHFQGQAVSEALSRLCEQSMMKSHISHISLLHSALLPNTVFNKHLKTASRQYWNDSMSSHVDNITRYVEKDARTCAFAHT